MRKIKKKSNRGNSSILIDKFITLLIRNGKKSKSNKLLTNCCVHSHKLLKKNFLTAKSLQKLNKNFNSKILISKNPLYPFLINQNGKEIGGHFTQHYRLKNSEWDRKHNPKIARNNKNKTKLLKTGIITSKNEQDIFFASFLKTKVFKKVFMTPPIFFQKSISRVRPLISLQKLRKGGRTKYIPRALSKKKGIALGIKWIINSSLKQHRQENRSNKKTIPISQSIAKELWECFLEQGNCWAKKEELHKLGLANKAFVRYNWW